MNPINLGTRYTYLIKGAPEKLTNVKNAVSLHGPGPIRKNKFVLTVTDSEMFWPSQVKQVLADFKKTCGEEGVKYSRVRFPFKALMRRLINK